MSDEDGKVDAPKTDWQAERAALKERLAKKDQELKAVTSTQKAEEEARQAAEARKRAEEEGKLKDYASNTAEENKKLKANLAAYEQRELDKAQAVYDKLPPSSREKLDLIRESMPLPQYMKMVELEAQSIQVEDKAKTESPPDYSHLIGAQGTHSKRGHSEQEKMDAIVEQEFEEYMGRPVKHLKDLKKVYDPSAGTSFSLPMRKFRAKMSEDKGVALTKKNDPKNQ